MNFCNNNSVNHLSLDGAFIIIPFILSFISLILVSLLHTYPLNELFIEYYKNQSNQLTILQCIPLSPVKQGVQAALPLSIVHTFLSWGQLIRHVDQLPSQTYILIQQIIFEHKNHKTGRALTPRKNGKNNHKNIISIYKGGIQENFTQAINHQLFISHFLSAAQKSRLSFFHFTLALLLQYFHYKALEFFL